MFDSLKSAVLAIDGGGTKSRFALQLGDQRIVAKAGPANASTDFEATVMCIQEGLTALAQRANVDISKLHDLPAFVGLAGVSGTQTAARLHDALPLSKAHYADDRHAALRGALGSRDGVVAHCGTGSFFAAQIGKRVSFAGGWGAILGDEASAQWVGRMALRQLLRYWDGFTEKSALIDRLMARFGNAEAVVQFAGKADPSDFGALAPLVTEQAEQGDAIARLILQTGADEMSSDLKLLGWAPGRAICLTGGIGPQYADYLPDDMQADLAKPLGTPLDGAIALAQEKGATFGHC